MNCLKLVSNIVAFTIVLVAPSFAISDVIYEWSANCTHNCTNPLVTGFVYFDSTYTPGDVLSESSKFISLTYTVDGDTRDMFAGRTLPTADGHFFFSPRTNELNVFTLWPEEPWIEFDAFNNQLIFLDESQSTPPGFDRFDGFTLVSTPEPSILILLGLGLIGLGWRRKKAVSLLA